MSPKLIVLEEIPEGEAPIIGDFATHPMNFVNGMLIGISKMENNVEVEYADKVRRGHGIIYWRARKLIEGGKLDSALK